MTSLKKKAYNSLLWQIGSISFTAISNIIFLMAMGRLIAPESFGIFALASVVIAITQIFAEFGFGPALIQKDIINQEHINFSFVASIGIGIILSIVIVLLSGFISTSYEGKVSALMIQVMSLNLVFSTIGSTSKALLIRELKFDKLFWVNSISYLFGNIFIGISLAWMGLEEWALLLSLLTTNLLSSLLYFKYRPINFTMRFTKKDSKDILNYGLGLTGVQLISQLAHQVDKLILGKIMPLDFLGSFERAQRIQRIPLTYAGSSIDGILFSVLSKMNKEGQRAGNFFFSLIAIISIATMYISVQVYFFAPDIIHFLLGNGWERAIGILKILACLIFIQTFSRFGDTFIRATKSFGKSSKVKTYFLVSIVAFTTLGYWISGVQGAIVGIVIAHVVHSITMVKACTQVADFRLGRFISLLLPIVGMSVILMGKNAFLLSFAGDNFLIKTALILLSDLLLFLLYFKYPLLIGKANAEFINIRLGEIGLLSKLSKIYSRNLSASQI